MHVVGPYSVPCRTKHPDMDAIGEGLRSWLAETVAEPLPESLAAMVRLLESEQIAIAQR